ncbi:MAG: SRPBCC family protein [Armatimonadota bacterium]|nr:SRPBCC family protein [Armatimonadota bacterium]MDR7451142.1 SRPBCC family protein [Armatimonadota bacterium]MDR7467253.1 SRPBCC family protein [Armatimonadota bacterium]MDR7494514.1 SRPBCC family protein [Armatimonadota bacterium]MDR7499909.1 SRPBCC family protein [Armatimonadota bacterium]
MHTRHEGLIRAQVAAVFALAADVDRWPALHPAYRWCRVLERSEQFVLFEMGGRIRGRPARWTARLEPRPAEGRMVFRHVAGITRGMIVEWRLQPVAEGTRVTIVHDLALSWPLLGGVVSDLLVGPVFIDWIAARTLAGLARILEGR